MIFVKQSLHISAYESVRRAVKRDETTDDVVARANLILNERRVNSATVTITPTDFETVDRGTPVTISVSAPTNENTILRLKFFSGDLESAVTMVKE